MFFKKKGLPKIGELVICTVTKILPHAAFVRLDEYENLEAMLHVSEVSSRWVKNIKDYLSEGKKIVCKVLELDSEKRHVNVSLKRVTSGEKAGKLNEEKTSTKIEKLIEFIANKNKLNVKESLNEVGSKLIEEFGSLSDFYEFTKKEGIDVINESSLSEEWKKELSKAMQEHFESLNVKIQKEFQLSSIEPDGIERIKSVLKRIDESYKSKGINIEFVYISAPRYMLSFTAKNYKEGQNILNKILEDLKTAAVQKKISVNIQ